MGVLAAAAVSEYAVAVAVGQHWALCLIVVALLVTVEAPQLSALWARFPAAGHSGTR